MCNPSFAGAIGTVDDVGVSVSEVQSSPPNQVIINMLEGHVC